MNTHISDIKELNFPKIDGKQYATLTQATVSLADMGEKTITSQIKIDGDIVPDFSFDWAVEFQGEKYIMPLRVPQGSKGNDSLNSQVDLTFQHWAIYQLKRWPFITIQQIEPGTYLPDEEVAPVTLNLKDFSILLGQVLECYYGETIKVDLNPEWQYDATPTHIEINHSKIWNVLVETLYKEFGARWEIAAATDNDNVAKGGERYVIRIGYDVPEVSHIFEYGFEGGLLKLERQVQSDDISNVLKGRGGDTNIPFRYFKNKDENNPLFLPDPDWIVELKNAYFTNLMGATFRSYVQGWKAAHIGQTDENGNILYIGYKAVGEENAYAPWAYRKGFTDTKFSPVEFVADEIVLEPTSDMDRRVDILPGYSPYVKSGSSLDKYGALPDTLDNNDDIYPTLQGTGVDIAVDISVEESDDVKQSVENDAQDRSLPNEQSALITINSYARADVEIKSRPFFVSQGKHANFDEGAKTITFKQPSWEDVWSDMSSWDQKIIEKLQLTVAPPEGEIVITNASVVVVDVTTGQVWPASGIPAGEYYYLLKMTVYNATDMGLTVQVECSGSKLTEATIEQTQWKNTFNLWVKDIWGSKRFANETDTHYSERIWGPILGDREENDAAVVFTSGELAMSEDYEFTIVDYPVPDNTKMWVEKNDEGSVVATHISHWKLTLAKSDAELESSGFYVPSTRRQGKPGDTFVFIGTEMMHEPYVVDAEIRLDDSKKDTLNEKKEVAPTFVATPDRVRLNGYGKADALIKQLRVGNSIRLADKRFIQPIGNRAYETLYLQSITYTYRAPSESDNALNADVSITLGNDYATSADPVTTMQSDISALRRQVGAISNVQQIVRAVGDKLYLRKDGIPDVSYSPTKFFSLLTSGDFRSSMIGGAGWGFYKDENNNWVLETDRLSVRQNMTVNSIVINQSEGRSGESVDTAAYIESVTRVDDTEDGYVCYFDQRRGSVANLFKVDDIAYCNQWTAENDELKFYKRRVVAVGLDCITLSKTNVNGTGIPAEGDNIIHFGNYLDAERQYLKVRNVVGGGYERYIEGLNSVDAQGVEYHFVGKQAGKSRWFVGHKDLVPYSGAGDGVYMEFIDDKLTLNNVTLSIGSKVGDKTLEQFVGGTVDSKYKYLSEALKQNTEIAGGLIMTTLISLGYTDSNNIRHTLAGMNGRYNAGLGVKSIGSWWGGDMLDLFKIDGKVKTEAELQEESGKTNPAPATALVRMDGSAYWSAGNVQFKADGTAQFGLGESSAIITADGKLILGNGIEINVGGDIHGLSDTLSNLSTIVNGFNNIFYPIDESGNRLNWNTPSENIHAIKSVKGFFSPEFVSALGLKTGELGGGGGGSSYDRLDTWSGYNSSKAGWVLSAYLGDDLNTRVGKNSSSITSILSRLDAIESGGFVDVVVGGSGNAITHISKGGTTLVATKGATFALASELSNFVTLDTTQTITGVKTFESGLTLPYAAGSWLSMATRSNQILGATKNTTHSAHSLFTIFSASGAALSYGGFNTDIGFYGFYKSRLDAETPGVDWQTKWSTADGTLTHTARFVAAEIVKSGGTAAQFLKADGSVDNTRYMYPTWVNNPGYDCDVIGHEPIITFTYNNNAPFTGAVVDFNVNGYGFLLGTDYPFDGSLYYRRHGTDADGKVGTWQRLACISDNVASATKLYASRSLWGQRFDGTSDVSGTINTANFGLYDNNDNPFLRLTQGNVDWYIQAGNGTLFMGVNPDTSILVTTNGFVGIGLHSSTTPQAMLHVEGTARVSALRIGDATITWDATNGGLKVDKGLYSQSYISALGITQSDNGITTMQANTATVDTIVLGGATITWDSANNVLKVNGKTIQTTD